jgi:hypothetical protein
MAEIAKIHGNDIRDKKIVDAQVSTTPSDVTSNSVIPVEAEDGTIIKLKRDSLVQAFASVLNSNSQSTITTLFGADANGNHANINMSNLASVMSVPKIKTLSLYCNNTVDGVKSALANYYDTNYDGSSNLHIITLHFNEGGHGHVLLSPNGYNYFAAIMINYYSNPVLSQLKYSAGTWS